MLIVQCFCNEWIVKVWFPTALLRRWYDEKAVVIDTIAYTAIGIINSLLWCTFHQTVLFFCRVS